MLVIIISIIIIIIISKNKGSAQKSISSVSPKSTNEKYKLIDFNDHFALVLDNTLKFIDAYLAYLPDEWVFISISPVSEKSEFSSDSCWYYEEFVEFKVNVGCWYNSILHTNKDAKEFMECIYDFDASDNSFSHRIRIGDSTNCMIPHDILKKKLFDCLDEYEKNNPNRKLTRTSYGVHHQWNL